MAHPPAEFPLHQSGLLKAIFRGDSRYNFVRAIYEPGGTFSWRQPFYQLVVILEGRADITIDDDQVTLRKGEGVLMHPGWEVSYLFSPDQRTTHTACHIDSSLLDSGDAERLACVRGVHRAPSIIHILIAEGLGAPVTAGARFHDALGLMAKVCLLRFAAEVSTSPGSGAPAHPALVRAFEALEANPIKFNTAHALAACCGVSVSRLRQIFREAGHESPSAIIWRLKVEHAVQMIRSTGRTLGEIAELSGFTNPFHLSRSVKNHTGQSPKEIRRHQSG